MVYIPPILPKSRARAKRAKALLFELIALSRNPFFYTAAKVPDTFDGRFEILTLLTVLTNNRLAKEEARENKAEAVKFVQALFDQLFLNLELALREMGVGDLSVPKQIKRMMQAYNGRRVTYEDLTIESNEKLRRNIYGTIETIPDSSLQTLQNFILLFTKSLNQKNFVEIVEWKNIPDEFQHFFNGQHHESEARNNEAA